MMDFYVIKVKYNGASSFIKYTTKDIETLPTEAYKYIENHINNFGFEYSEEVIKTVKELLTGPNAGNLLLALALLKYQPGFVENN